MKKIVVSSIWNLLSLRVSFILLDVLKAAGL